jgi:hypothetical protein
MVCESTTTKKTEETICGNTSNFVYVRSKEHSWVPARVLETKEKEAIVQLLNYRDEQSILSCNDGRIAGSVEMSVQLNDYPAQSLPLQNVNEDGSLIQVEDMVDLSFLHEVSMAGMDIFDMLAGVKANLTPLKFFLHRLPFSTISNRAISMAFPTQEPVTL